MSALLDDNQHRSGNERDVADTGMELHLQNLSMDQLSNEDIPVLDLASSPSNHDHSDHEGDPLSAGQATSDLAVTVGAQDVHQTPTRAGGVLMILPAELRIRVYKHVFSGSEVTLSIWDYRATRGDKEHRDGAGEKEHEARLTGISHSGSCYPLLLTGSTIHHDAMATYWATTVVHCQGASERCFLDDFVNVAPPALLENARHIRNIMLPHVSSKRVQGRPELRAQALLDRFPRLDSCEFVLSRTDRKYGKIKDVMSSDNMINSATGAPLVRWRHDYDYGFVLRCKQGSEPMVWLAAAYGIDTNYPVHFLSRFRELSYYVSTHELQFDRIVYVDYTTCTYATTKTDLVNAVDEYHFQCVMNMKEQGEAPDEEEEEEEEVQSDREDVFSP